MRSRAGFVVSAGLRPPPPACADERSLALQHDTRFGEHGVVQQWDGTPFRVDMVRNFPEFVADADLRQLLAPVGWLADQIEAQLGYRIVEMGELIRPGGPNSESNQATSVRRLPPTPTTILILMPQCSSTRCRAAAKSTGCLSKPGCNALPTKAYLSCNLTTLS